MVKLALICRFMDSETTLEKIYLLLRRCSPAGGPGPAEPPLASWFLTTKSNFPVRTEQLWKCCKHSAVWWIWSWVLPFRMQLRWSMVCLIFRSCWPPGRLLSWLVDGRLQQSLSCDVWSCLSYKTAQSLKFVSRQSSRTETPTNQTRSCKCASYCPEQQTWVWRFCDLDREWCCVTTSWSLVKKQTNQKQTQGCLSKVALINYW